MTKLICTVGLPASGKSTWAKNKIGNCGGRWKIVCQDDLRLMLDNSQYNKANEAYMKKIRDDIVASLLFDGYNVIIADTNLSPKVQNKWREVAKKFNAEFSIKDFTDVSLKTCIKRDLARANSVGQDVITNMYNTFLKPAPVFTYKQNNTLPKAIIVDIDGTLAHNDGKRSPYDEAKVGMDSVDKVVAKTVSYYKDAGYAIIIMSGRSSGCREETLSWLKVMYNIPFDLLFMRKEGDSRKDSIVKRELFMEHVNGVYDVELVLDDRTQVVDMWRDMGLKCYQVAFGDF